MAGIYQNEALRVIDVDPATGNPRTSSTVSLSSQDKTALDNANSGYTTAALYTNNQTRTAGRGILATITTAGTATLTFGGVDIQFSFSVGPTILPIAVTKTVLGTAVGSFYAIS